MLSCLTVTVSLSKIAMHPASHIFPTEISELFVIPGMMCAILASSGSWFSCSKHSSPVDWSLFPFGRPTRMGVLFDPVLKCGSCGLR